MNLSAVILTLNEERNLRQCLEGISRLGCPIFIVDSGSTDRTPIIAREHGAVVVEHAFRTHNEQWSWALQNLPIATDWVMGLDSDQSLTPELALELQRTFAGAGSPDVDGFYVCRRQIFRGRWIRHGGYYPKYLLKIFRRDKVFFDKSDLLDHHFYVPGRTLKLKHDIVEDNRNEYDLSFWIQKHTRYAAVVAREEYERRTREIAAPIRPGFFGSPDQRGLALRSRWRQMPLFVRPVLYFIYRYIFRGGWMDGKQGFLFHFLHAFWFRVVVDAHLDELLTPANAPGSITQ